MRNERKSISLLGWIIGALLLIYLGVFCYLNLCKYAQHVDSDIAAEALLAREIWVEKDITPNDWISSTERRIIGMPTVAAVFYGITGSMQTAAGITCVLLGAILLVGNPGSSGIFGTVAAKELPQLSDGLLFHNGAYVRIRIPKCEDREE